MSPLCLQCHKTQGGKREKETILVAILIKQCIMQVKNITTVNCIFVTIELNFNNATRNIGFGLHKPSKDSIGKQSFFQSGHT